jgi:hypothetical protein
MRPRLTHTSPVKPSLQMLTLAYNVVPVQSPALTSKCTALDTAAAMSCPSANPRGHGAGTRSCSQAAPIWLVLAIAKNVAYLYVHPNGAPAGKKHLGVDRACRKNIVRCCWAVDAWAQTWLCIEQARRQQCGQHVNDTKPQTAIEGAMLCSWRTGVQAVGCHAAACCLEPPRQLVSI